MIYQQLIGKYRSIRKKKILGGLSGHKKNYAFLGVGEHSMANLYPILHHLNIPLKYIYSRTRIHAAQMASTFPGTIATDNLDQIMQDHSVDALFVCLQPDDHHTITSQALRAGKNIFVEKPPCRSSMELEELISLAKDGFCQPGLQRRTSMITRLLNQYKLIDECISYRYTFHCGLYPDGDVYTELFIHPVDYLLFLFGNYQSANIQTSRNGNGITCQIQLVHESGVHGQVELSTDFSWQNLHETIEINTRSKTVAAIYPGSLSSSEKSALFGMPLEKINPRPKVVKTYLDPLALSTTAQNNSLFLQGFASAIMA
ncbi:MAG: Gfo/Idh/MocA family oxidoreductase, partial [Chitinophagaceae bacterium]